MSTLIASESGFRSIRELPLRPMKQGANAPRSPMNSLRSFLLLLVVGSLALAEDAPDYETKVAPLFKKYCSACHNGEDLDGGLSLESFAALQEGGENGPALLPGDAKSSKLVRMLTGQTKPKMPPKDQPAPTA